MRTVSTFPLMEGDPGLVTHWAPGKFAPTGQAFMNKVLNRRSFRVATGTHNVPRNVWCDVELPRQGTTTTVKVNGTTGRFRTSCS